MPLKTTAGTHGEARKGRGATLNIEGRYERAARAAFDDGWSTADDSVAAAPRLATSVSEETARSIISRNQSPDLPFSLSINPYRGCEHGCVYCYARPSHAYLGLSPGLDFETRLFAKTNAAQLLREELARPGYRCEVINIGANTDGYQPVERRFRITRSLLEVLAECRHPLAIITKNAMVERDIDLLAPMAAQGLAHVTVSVTTLDHDLARHMEPRASAPARRIATIQALAAAGIPVAINVAPVIAFLSDHELEDILAAGHAAGATAAGYTLLRLPWELKDIFRAWLSERFPLKAERIMARQQDIRGGKDNDPAFGSRMHGQGLYADLVRQRFNKTCARLGLACGGRWAIGELRTDLFMPPAMGGQLRLAW
jgi:DNA repair photolyase